MKSTRNIIIGLIITVFSLVTTTQAQVNSKLQAAAQKLVAKKVYKVNVIVDNTVKHSRASIEEMIREVNLVYIQVGIHFEVNVLLMNAPPISSETTSLDRTLIKKHHKNFADLTIFITGNHTGSVIGVSTDGVIGTNNAVLIVDVNFQHSVRACSGILVHEIGHQFGLEHGHNRNYIMSENGNGDYCRVFSPSNLSILRSL